MKNGKLVAIWLLVFAITAGTLATEAGTPQNSGKAIRPSEPVLLFNGKDLTNFYTWLVDHKFEDPDRVFSVVDQIDGAPAIRISGERWGGIVTKQAYRDYHLIFEYRWGLTTWGERKSRTRDSGNTGSISNCIPWFSVSYCSSPLPQRSSPALHRRCGSCRPCKVGFARA